MWLEAVHQNLEPQCVKRGPNIHDTGVKFIARRRHYHTRKLLRLKL